MKINWTVRIKNKAFWVAFIPALLLLIQQICGMFGVEIHIADLQEELLGIIGTVFMLLTILGIVVDPTTDGVSDSSQALTYEEPRKDGEEDD